MSKSYLISMEDGITTVRFSESPTLEESINAVDEIVQNFPYELRLWDFTKIIFNLSSKELEKIAHHAKANFTKKPSKAAFVTANKISYKNIRILTAYSNFEDLEVRSFHCLEKAIAWLKEPAPDPAEISSSPSE